MRRWIADSACRAKSMLLVFSVFACYGCLTVDMDPSPERTRIGEPDCFDLSLKDDVPVTLTVGERMIALTYEETAYGGEESALGEAQFTNIYLILTGISEDATFTPRIGRLTINIWIINSAEPISTCYQWRLLDEDMDGFVDEVAGEIVDENREGTVKGIHPLRNLHRNMNDFSQLYRYCLDHLVRNLNVSTLDELFYSSRNP